MKRFSPITIACALFLSIIAGHCADTSIRGMYVEQEKDQSASKNTGACYWLEVKRKDEEPQRCTNKTAFYQGDKLRIHLKANVDGYAYIVLKGSDGDKDVLFPAKDLGSNKVKAGEWMVLPASKEDDQAWLKFDETPGIENLRMIVSREKIDPEQKLDDDSVVISDKDSKDKVPEGTVVSITISKGTNIKSGLRNLVIDHDAKPESEGETTVVGKADKPLAIDISLKHKAGSR